MTWAFCVSTSISHSEIWHTHQKGHCEQTWLRVFREREGVRVLYVIESGACWSHQESTRTSICLHQCEIQRTCNGQGEQPVKKCYQPFYSSNPQHKNTKINLFQCLWWVEVFSEATQIPLSDLKINQRQLPNLLIEVQLQSRKMLL